MLFIVRKERGGSLLILDKKGYGPLHDIDILHYMGHDMTHPYYTKDQIWEYISEFWLLPGLIERDKQNDKTKRNGNLRK